VRVLGQVSSELNSTLDLDAICAAVLRTMNDLFGFRHSIILLLDEGGRTLTVAATGVIGLAAQRRRVLRIGNLSRHRSSLGRAAWHSWDGRRSRSLAVLTREPEWDALLP
jgi:adenylate cyclase